MFTTSQPEDHVPACVQAGWDSAAGKDFNKDLGAGLDSLNKSYEQARPLHTANQHARIPATVRSLLQLV